MGRAKSPKIGTVISLPEINSSRITLFENSNDFYTEILKLSISSTKYKPTVLP